MNKGNEVWISKADDPKRKLKFTLEMVKSNKKIGYIPLQNYVHLGSENEYKEYSYWENNIKLLLKSHNA